MELLNIAAYAYQDVHVWSALLTCLRPLLFQLFLHFQHRITRFRQASTVWQSHPTASGGDRFQASNTRPTVDRWRRLCVGVLWLKVSDLCESRPTAVDGLWSLRTYVVLCLPHSAGPSDRALTRHTGV